MDFMEIETGTCKLTCHTAPSPATPGTLWWWLQPAGESQRYAAFRTDSSDTLESVRPRLTAYYDKLLADRARPREIRSHWSSRRPAAKPDATETGPATD